MILDDGNELLPQRLNSRSGSALVFQLLFQQFTGSAHFQQCVGEDQRRHLMQIRLLP
jgi:hypothetical protein